MIGRLMFAIVDFAARKGLADPTADDSAKQRARQTGIRGETYAYWYLRRHGYLLVARRIDNHFSPTGPSTSKASAPSPYPRVSLTKNAGLSAQLRLYLVVEYWVSGWHLKRILSSEGGIACPSFVRTRL